MVTINYDKCVGCGKCAAVCPGIVIFMRDGLPAVVGDGCIACGHCVETCTHGAVSIDTQLAEAPKPQSELEKNILTRRSTRNFLPAAPERDVLERALSVAAWAPSAKNQNKNGWAVVYRRHARLVPRKRQKPRHSPAHGVGQKPRHLRRALPRLCLGRRRRPQPRRRLRHRHDDA